jgi:hypothetical protein
MSNRAWGAECPECGGMFTRAENSGFDTEGNRIRSRKCQECGHHFATVEIHVPGMSFHRANSIKRGRWSTPRPVKRTPDHIRVKAEGDSLSVTLVKGKRLNVCRSGLHELVGDNVYVNPNTGHRSCSPCRRKAARELYAHKMAHMPPALLEEWREKDRKRSQRRRAA